MTAIGLFLDRASCGYAVGHANWSTLVSMNLRGVFGLFLASAVLSAAGCSSLGVSFQRGASFAAQQNSFKSNVVGYGVERISASLVRDQLASRRHSEIGLANPSLTDAITSYEYRVEPRDVLSIVVWGNQNQVAAFSPGIQAGSSGSTPTALGFKVNPQGEIYFPYVGDIRVAGKSVSAIRDRLATRLQSFLKDPQVTVDIAQFNSQKFELAGAVVKPGLYPVTDQPLTVSQAIAAAGGVIHQVPNTITTGNTIPRPLADLSHVVYIHEGTRTILDMRALALYGDKRQDRLVHAGDVIQVPDNSNEQIHVIGEVRNPGNYPLDNGEVNLAQILGDAGGLNLTTADKARIFVFRGAAQKPQVFWLDARSPQSMLLATSFELEPQDVVYVAAKGVSNWNRIVTQILPTVQTLYETKTLIK